MRSTLKRIALSLIYFLAELVGDLARWLQKDSKTTAAGVVSLLAWLASHYNFVIPAGAQSWIVMLALVVISKLAKDSHTERTH